MQPRRVTLLVAFGAALAGLVPAASAGASSHSPASAGGDYCEAQLALESALASEDPEDDAAAAEAAQAAAPEELADALTTMMEQAPTDGPPSPEFTEASAAIVDYLRENCGFAELDVLAQEYSFGGIGGEIPAGPTIVNLHNEGEEFHEIVMFRRNEGVTETVEELLALPEEEAFGLVTFVGYAVAAPGETGSAVVDLTPGEYFALCFVPVGTTAEVMDQMMAEAGGGSVPPDASAAPAETMAAEDTAADAGAAADASTPPDGSAPPGEGPPHFTEGMFVEFTVVEGGAAGTGASDTSAATDAAGTSATTEGSTDTAADTTATTTG